MAIFDAEISALASNVSVPSDEALESGVDPTLEFSVVAGLLLPIANPETGEPVVIPAGRIRFSYTREQAIEVFSKALEAAQNLPEQFRPSGKVAIAHDLSEVERAANSIKKVTGR